MKSAIAVLAYRQPQVLRAAIPLYKAAGIDIFLHVDQKADLQKYTDALGPHSEHCTIVSPRIDIYWAGFSMVEAEISIIRQISAVSAYDRIILISDDTFPLLTPSGMVRFFQNEQQFVMLRKLGEEDPFLKRYTGFFFFDHKAMSLLGRPVESSEVTPDLIDRIADLQRIMHIGKKPMEIYYGSQWWSLTRDAFDKVLSYYDNDYLMKKSFEYSAVPDEIFVQSIVGNFVDRAKVRSGPVFVDWSREPRPFLFTSASQIPERAYSDHAFIRKVGNDATTILHDLRDRLLQDDQ